MHRCTSAFGYAAFIASFIPVSPSTQNISTSSTPLFLRSFNTPSQNFDDSLSPIQIPKISLLPSTVIPITTYAARSLFFLHLSLYSELHP